MSAADVEIVRRSLEGFIVGDLQWDLTSPDIVIRDFDIPDAAGAYHGHEGFNKWMADWDAAFEATALAIERIDDRGDRVVAIINITARGRSSGIETKRRNAIVYEVRGGQITKSDYYTTEEEAAAALESAAHKA